MKQTTFEIAQNLPLAKGVYKMTLRGDTSAITRPGQFVNILLDGLYLRRPISVADLGDGTLTLIYKTVGKGTEYMTTLEEGAKLDALSGLGNGFDTSRAGENPLIIGGGVGCAPLLYLCRKLVGENKKPTAVLGFGSSAEVFLEKELSELGVRVYVATADGSRGKKGFVTDVISKLDLKYSYFYACGPMPMITAADKMLTGDGEYSLEARMGCGFGACMGCSIRTADGMRRVCADGPVFSRTLLFLKEK